MHPNDAPAVPTEEHMLGHGFYNKHAQEQAAASPFGLDLIPQAVHAIDASKVGSNLPIADYGCAQGHNSLLPIKTVIENFNALSYAVTHTDLPTNDWTTLFQTVLTDANSYLAGKTNVFAFASGTSIYRQIFPPQSIAFGYSAITTHWMSRKPSNLNGQIFSTRDTGATHDVWAAQARADWYAFLHNRCTELIPTGQLLMVNSGANAAGMSGAEPLLDLANATLQAMVKQGTLRADEYAQMAIPTYYRTESEWRAPFQDASFIKDNPLTLRHYAEVALDDVYVDRYKQNHDANAFAGADAAFFSAAFEPSLFVSLADRAPDARQQVINTFRQNLRAALAQNPTAYPARWVLQVMWVSKA